MSDRTLQRRMATSTLWSALSSFGNQVFAFVTFVVIARMVSPAEFGLVALASLLIGLVQIVSSAGMHDAVVQRRELPERAASTAFWFNMLVGALLTGAMWLLAEPAAALFRTPELGRVVAMLAPTFLIGSLGAVHSARLARDFGFRALAMRNLGASLASGLVSMAMALTGFGVDALVAQRLVSVATISVIGIASYRWLPGLALDLPVLRQLAGFGSRVVGAQLLTEVSSKLPDLAAGLVLGPGAVGLLRIANRCTEMVMQLVITPFQHTALPTLSRTQDDPALMRSTFLGISRLSALIILPAYAGFLAIAPLAIPALFGAQWAGAAPLVQIICCVAVVLQLNALLPPALAACGHPADTLRWSALQLVMGVVFTAVSAPFGITALVTANLLLAYLMLPLSLFLLRRRTGVAPGSVLASIARPLAASIAMAGAVIALRRALPAALPLGLTLAACVGAGGASYAGLSLLLDPGLPRQARDLLRRRAEPPPGSAPA